MLKAPASLRDTVMLFATARGKINAADVFAQVDWSGVTRRQLIHAFLDRPPASAAEAYQPADFDARAAALALFESSEFRAGIVHRLLDSFPGKRRLLFVHVPKSAGTDFIAAMRGALPSVEVGFAQPELISVDLLARRLGTLGQAVKTSDTIFMGGHISLAWFLDQKIYRFRDRVVAIVRHPHEICVSMANYIVHGFRSDPCLTRPDTRSWARTLGLGAEDIGGTDLRTLALDAVTRQGTQPVNPICSLLGDGTARGTFDTLARAPIEITGKENYAAWLRHNWNIERSVRANASQQVIGWADLEPWQRQQIEDGCAEDRIVYDAVMACLKRAGTLSVTGPAVAAFASGGA